MTANDCSGFESRCGMLWQTNNEPSVQALVLSTSKTKQLLGYVLINEAAPWMEVVAFQTWLSLDTLQQKLPLERCSLDSPRKNTEHYIPISNQTSHKPCTNRLQVEPCWSRKTTPGIPTTAWNPPQSRGSLPDSGGICVGIFQREPCRLTEFYRIDSICKSKILKDFPEVFAILRHAMSVSLNICQLPQTFVRM